MTRAASWPVVFVWLIIIFAASWNYYVLITITVTVLSTLWFYNYYLLLWLYNYYGFCPSTNCFSDLANKSLPSVSGPCCDQTWAKRPPIPSYPPNRMINSPSNEISVSYNTGSCYSYNCSVHVQVPLIPLWLSLFPLWLVLNNQFRSLPNCKRVSSHW